MELLKLDDDGVGPQIGQGMGILLDAVGFGLDRCQAPPVGGEGAEKEVVVKAAFLGGDAEHAFDTGEIRDGFSVDHGSFYRISADGFEAVVIIHELLGSGMEQAVILLGPPVAQVPLLVVLAP